MRRADIEFAQAQTHKLEALGIVLGHGSKEYLASLPCDIGRPLHPHPRRGRKRVYSSAALKQRAYRGRRSKSRVLRNRPTTIDS
jgi:hypothetical protein